MNTQKKVTKNVFDYGALSKVDEDDIAPYLLRARTQYEVRDEEYSIVDVDGVIMADCSPVEALKKCKNWLALTRAATKVSKTFADIVTASDLIIHTGSVQPVGKEVMIPVGGSIDPQMKNAAFALARDVSNIIVLHTTHVAGTPVEEWITPAKAKLLNIPHIPGLVKVRQVLNTPGNPNFQTRDLIYSKLTAKDNASLAMLLYSSTLIYSCEMLKPYAQPHPDYSKTYDKIRGQLPSLPGGVWVPKYTKFVCKVPNSDDLIWKFHNASLQQLGDRKRRGVMSIGYYRFDLPSADVHIIDEATDLINICKRYKATAIRVNDIDPTLALILITNDISIYSNASRQAQPANGKVGIWQTGNAKKVISWGLYSVVGPTFGDNKVTHPPPLRVVSQEIFFNYIKLPPTFDPNYNYYPSIRASEGLCIMSNASLPGCVKFSPKELYSRFAQAQYYRNWFPYLRITFQNQDRLRIHFKHPWIYPKREEKTVTDFFSTARVVTIDVDDNQLVSGYLTAIEPYPEEIAPTPEQFEAYLLTLTLDEIKEVAAGFSKKQLKGEPLKFYQALYEVEYGRILGKVYDILDKADKAAAAVAGEDQQPAFESGDEELAETEPIGPASGGDIEDDDALDFFANAEELETKVSVVKT